MKWDQTTDTTKYPYIVDTGTTMLYLPTRKYMYFVVGTANAYNRG